MKVAVIKVQKSEQDVFMGIFGFDFIFFPKKKYISGVFP